MVIKIYFRKNLKISAPKLAAACTHIGNQLGQCVKGQSVPRDDVVIILRASDKKFNEIKEDIIGQERLFYHLHIDNGFTEVEPGTEIAIGWLEDE